MWITLNPPLPFSKATHPSDDPELKDQVPPVVRGYVDQDSPDRPAYDEACRAWQQAYEPLLARLKARKTFCTEGWNRPGIQFELEDGRRFLIGDVTPAGDDHENPNFYNAFDINLQVTRVRDLMADKGD